MSIVVNFFGRWARRLWLPVGLLYIVSLGTCSNFDERKRYWDRELATKLKGANSSQLKAFAASNRHEIHCSDKDSEYGECYFVDARSKGALFNSRGRLFVMISMTNDRATTHSYQTSLVLH
jgi:hypothetical protein